MSEVPSDPDELGIPKDEIEVPTSRERIGDSFLEQLGHLKQLDRRRDVDGLYAEGGGKTNDWESVYVEKDNLFVVFKQELGSKTLFHRTYFAQDPGTGRFEEIAKCKIDGSIDKDIEFQKFGGNLGQSMLERRTETLAISLGDDMSQIEYLNLKIVLDGVIKGDFAYTNEGDLFDIIIDSVYSHDDEDFRVGTDDFTDNTMRLPDFETEAEEGFDLKSKDDFVWGKVNKKDGNYLIRLSGGKENVIYDFEIPQHIQTDEVVAKTNAGLLLKNPTATSDLDRDWKFKDLPSIVGAKVN